MLGSYSSCPLLCKTENSLKKSQIHEAYLILLFWDKLKVLYCDSTLNLLSGPGDTLGLPQTEREIYKEDEVCLKGSSKKTSSKDPLK